MKSLVRKLFGARGRVHAEGRRRPVCLGLEALEERAVSSTMYWKGMTGPNVEDAGTSVAPNWVTARGALASVPGSGDVADFGGGGFSITNDPRFYDGAIISYWNPGSIKSESGFAGHTLSLDAHGRSNGYGLLLTDTVTTSTWAYGDIKFLGKSGGGTNDYGMIRTQGNFFKWVGGNILWDTNGGMPTVYISNSGTLQVSTGSGGATDPGSLNVAVGIGYKYDPVNGVTEDSGTMSVGGANGGVYYLDEDFSVAGSGAIKVAPNGTLSFNDDSGNVGGMHNAGVFHKVITNKGAVSRAVADSTDLCTVDAQLLIPSGATGATFTLGTSSGGAKIKFTDNGGTGNDEFVAGSGNVYITAGSHLAVANEAYFDTGSNVFLKNDTGASCTVSFDGSLYLHGCSFYTAYDSGVSSHAQDNLGNYVWTTIAVSGDLTINNSTWTQFGGQLGGSTSCDHFTVSGACTLGTSWQVIMDVTGAGGSGTWTLISGYNSHSGTAPGNTDDISAYAITYDATSGRATY
jgi:hypothetical protein